MENMTYESAMKKLEKTVEKLEKGSIPLDETIKLYDEGIKLSAFCTGCLDGAEQKITELENLGEKKTD